MNLITPAAIFSAVALKNTFVRNVQLLWYFITIGIKNVAIQVINWSIQIMITCG